MMLVLVAMTCTWWLAIALRRCGVSENAFDGMVPGSLHHVIEFRTIRRTASTLLRFSLNANFVSRARGAGT